MSSSVSSAHRTKSIIAHPKSRVSQVRIIGGEYRRRLLSFVDTEGLRPTPDRVRETLFNWLADDLPQSRVLDCCAGSGVLGFEALSRGASYVDLIEPNSKQFNQLVKSKTTLGILDQQMGLHLGKAENVITSLPKLAYDGIFLDPPYALDLWKTIVTHLLEQQLLTPTTWLYIEANRPVAEVLPHYIPYLYTIKDKKMGQIYSGLYNFTTLPPVNQS